jgi:hypothetical protein
MPGKWNTELVPKMLESYYLMTLVAQEDFIASELYLTMINVHSFMQIKD